MSNRGRSPHNDQELAEYCQCPLVLIEELRQFNHEMQITYLDTPIINENSDRETRLGDLELVDHGGSLSSADHLDLINAINALPERERGIVYARFFKEQTQSQIAEEFGVSRIHVSRLLTKSFLILRQQLSAEGDDVLVVQATQTAGIRRRARPAWQQAAIGRDVVTSRLAIVRSPAPQPKLTQEEEPLSPTATKYQSAQCRLGSFLMAVILWSKVSANVDKTYVDYGGMFKEVGLEKPKVHVVQNAVTRLKDQDIVVATGRCAFKRGPNSKVTFLGPAVEPFPKVIPGFRTENGKTYDLADLADQLKRRGAPATAAPPPTPTPPTPEAPPIQEKPAVVTAPTPSGNGRTHHLPELDYTPETLRAKAEGLRAQAQQLIQQVEILEEAARIKTTHAKEIMGINRIPASRSRCAPWEGAPFSFFVAESRKSY